MILRAITHIQKVRPNTNWETYRLGLPKSMVQALGLQKTEVLIELKKDKIVITKAPEDLV